LRDRLAGPTNVGGRNARAPETAAAADLQPVLIIASANLGDMLDFFVFFVIGYVLALIIGSAN